MAEQEVKAIFSADTSGITSGAKQAASSVKGCTDSISKGMGNADKPTKTLGASIKNIAVGVGAVAAVTAAIGVLKGSIGSAVGRFDTLNAYPKIMKQMGFSTKDTDSSIKILKKGIDGLPTSLQEITKSSQSFSILTKSATTGAKTATALNDAFLASGASAGDASRGVQQYSQMLSSGKVDMQSWRTLQETMPYALTKVANSFGLTGKSAEKDLYAKLKSGEITIDQLNDRFVELDGGVKGFAKTARKATGGIGTSFTNMRNAVTNGMANMITAVDNGLKSAGLGGIAAIFDQAKKAIVSSFIVINKVVETSVPVIIDIFKKLYPVIKNIAPLIAGLGGGFIAASVGITVFTKAASGVTSVLSAIYKHPVISMIILLSTAFYEAYVNIKPFHDFVDKVAKKLSDLATQAMNSKGAIEKLKVLLGVLGGAAGLGVVIAGIIKFKNGLNMMTKPMTVAESGISKIAKTSGKSSVKLLSMATSILAIGVGIGAATAGIGLLVFSITELAKSGSAGTDALFSVVMAIAAVVGIFAVLGRALTAGTVGIVAFGVAVLAIGVGVGVAAAGIALLVKVLGSADTSFSQIIKTMSAVGAGFAAMVTSFLTAIMVQAPLVVNQFILMIINIINVITAQLPNLIASGVNLIVAFISGITTAIPQLAPVIMNLLNVITQTIVAYLPTLIQDGVSIIVAFVSGITTAIPQVVPAIMNMLAVLMNTVAANLPQIIQSGANLLVSFIKGIISIIPTVVPVIIDLIVTIINTVAGKLGDIINAGVNLLVKFIQGVAQTIPKIVGTVVNFIVTFIGAVANNLGKIINAGINLLAKFIMGIVNAIPRLTGIAVQAVERFVYGVGNALGQIMASGNRLLSIFVQGIMSGYGKANGSGSGAARQVLNGISGISLFHAGASIMSGFLSGLRSMWGGITSFVGKIAGWIKAHKGPISYDKRLLIPAGNAIMGGFNNSLQSRFEDVKKTVNGVAPYIQNAMDGSSDYMINTRLADNMQLSDGTLSVDMNKNSQPAQINLNMGGSQWNAYVGDISNTQGNNAQLKRNNSVYL